jgi:hypothetical protein
VHGSRRAVAHDPTVSPGWPSRTADLVAVAFCLLAYAATARLVGRAREVLQPKIGTAHAALVPLRHCPARRLATILITLALFGIGLTKLLVGGAFATVLDRHRRSAEPLQLVRGDGPHARPAGTKPATAGAGARWSRTARIHASAQSLARRSGLPSSPRARASRPRLPHSRRPGRAADGLPGRGDGLSRVHGRVIYADETLPVPRRSGYVPRRLRRAYEHENPPWHYVTVSPPAPLGGPVRCSPRWSAAGRPGNPQATAPAFRWLCTLITPTTPRAAASAFKYCG